MKGRDAVVCVRESTVEVIVQIRIYPYYIQELCPSESLEFFFRKSNKNGSMLMKLY
jgi:hypothetical protein